MANNAKQDSKERLRSLEQRKERKRNQRPKPGSFEYVSNIPVPGNYRLSYR